MLLALSLLWYLRLLIGVGFLVAVRFLTTVNILVTASFHVLVWHLVGVSIDVSAQFRHMALHLSPGVSSVHSVATIYISYVSHTRGMELTGARTF